MKILSEWYETLPGKLLLEQEKAQWRSLLIQQTGSHIVQVGGALDLLNVTTCPIAHQIRIDRDRTPSQTSSFVKANITELPLLMNSVDVIFFPHVLEFLHQPKGALQEAYHALAAGGRIIIMGFNPWSPWVWMRYLYPKLAIPRYIHAWSMYSVKQWLAGMGFENINDHTFCFRPPLTDETWYDRLFFLEATGPVIAPGFGAVYMIVAEKPSNSMMPLKVRRWSKNVNGKKGFAETTNCNEINK